MCTTPWGNPKRGVWADILAASNGKPGPKCELVCHPDVVGPVMDGFGVQRGYPSANAMIALGMKPSALSGIDVIADGDLLSREWRIVEDGKVIREGRL